jgi:hypothetical protein
MEEQLIPITFTLESSGTKKLQLVKAVKYAFNLGLKETKDLIDNAPIVLSTRITHSDLKSFKDGLASTDAQYDLRDSQHHRNKKMIDLGICETSDISDELVRAYTSKIILTKDYRGVLNEIFDKLDKETIEKIYKNFDFKELEESLKKESSKPHRVQFYGH